MKIERETREYRDGWRTVCKVEVDLGNAKAWEAARRVTVAEAMLLKDGLLSHDILFDTEVDDYFDGDRNITHTVSGTRAATAQEIQNAQRAAHRAELAHETALRKQLADIEARRTVKP